VVALDHDPPADVEPEAGALADRLGGVEGLQDVGGGLGDAGAVVAGGADGQPAAAVHTLHGVDGVVDQVVQTWLSSPA
jgi:hypothetical protein